MNVESGPTQWADPVESLAAATDTVLPLIDAYFTHLYPLPICAVLHRQSVTQAYLDGSLEPCLTRALCAVTAHRLRILPYYPNSVARWAEQAEAGLMSNIKSPSVPRLQALVLFIRYLVDSGQFPQAFMLTALAARAAAALGLHQERPQLSSCIQEVRHRLIWSCCLLDGNFSVGMRAYEVCPPEMVEVQLPCSEAAFEECTPEVTARLQPISTHNTNKLSLFAAIVLLLTVRRKIMR
jgi:hypothetical protein